MQLHHSVGSRRGAAAAILIVVTLAAAAARAQVVTISDARASESGPPMIFTLTLSPAGSAPVTVHYATGEAWPSPYMAGWDELDRGRARPGADFKATSGTLVFAPGETTKTIPVRIRDDSASEGEEAFALDITAEGADVGDGRAFGVIIDDEYVRLGCERGYCVMRFPVQSVYDEGTGTWQPGIGSVRVTAVYEYADSSWSMDEDWWYRRRQRDRIAFLQTRLITSSGRVGTEWDGTESDFECNEWFDVRGGSRTLDDFDLDRSFDLLVNGDEYADKSCRFRLTASGGPWSAWGCWGWAGSIAYDYYDLKRLARVTYSEPGYAFGPVSFVADSFVSVPLVSVSGGQRAGERGAVLFTVSLDAATNRTVTVDYETVDGTATAGSDYRYIYDTLYFPPGTTQQTIAVAMLDDGVAEGDETFDLRLSSPENAMLRVARASATIADGDPSRPDLLVTGITSLRAARSGGYHRVNYEIQNVGEATAMPSHVLIGLSSSPGLWTATVPPLTPGATARGIAWVRLPTLPTGAHTLVVMADSAAEVTEAREWDNVAKKLIVTGPDLEVTMSVTPSPTGGNPYAVRVRTTNLGSLAPAPSVTKLYRSADGLLDAGDVEVGATAVPSLAPRAHAVADFSVDLAPGTWWLIARSERSPGASDAREVNNVRRVRVLVP